MALYAILDNNLVTNVIVANTQEIAEEATNAICVEISENTIAGIGFTYDKTNNLFIPPNPALEG